jgi:hypothetical protein
LHVILLQSLLLLLLLLLLLSIVCSMDDCAQDNLTAG